MSSSFSGDASSKLVERRCVRSTLPSSLPTLLKQPAGFFSRVTAASDNLEAEALMGHRPRGSPRAIVTCYCYARSISGTNVKYNLSLNQHAFGCAWRVARGVQGPLWRARVLGRELRIGGKGNEA